NRRVFIKGLGYVSLGLIFSSALGGCESLLEQIKNRPVRRRLRAGSAEVDQTLAIYKDAVAQMRALPAADPRSWSSQAAIHGTVSGGFNFCQHGSDHFFSWHRAYLLYFERICQRLTGNKQFGLPYWNWNQDPAMHAAFTDPNSVLFHARSNTSVGANAAFSNATLNTIFSDNNFFTFSSQLEGTPHNTAHVIVGGDMVSGGSPLDPIFWMHHCMVDYCWTKWNLELGRDNPNGQSWFSTSWDHFVDGNGDAANVTAGSTVLMPFLSYRYEPSRVGGFAPVVDLTQLSNAELKQIETRLRRGADIRFDIRKRVLLARGIKIPLAAPRSITAQITPADLKTVIETTRVADKIFIRVNYAQVPPSNDFFVRVFINLPAADASTTTDDIHYAGSFAFFGTHAAHAATALEHNETHRPKTDFL